MSVLTVKNLTKNFAGMSALCSVDMVIKPGEIMGLLGPKGAGKTTLLKLLSGIILPDSGSAEINGKPCAGGLSTLQIPCGVVIEDAKLYWFMTAMENINFFARLSGLEGRVSKERASALMHGLGVWQHKDVPIMKLGNSALKRLRVAISLVSCPAFVMWDDIGQDLDDRSICEIYDYLTDLVEKEGIAALVTSENGMYMDFCHRYTVMEHGRVLVQGETSDLMKAAGLKPKARLRTADKTLPPESAKDFAQDAQGAFLQEVEKEADMEALVHAVVCNGGRLIEAGMVRPGLQEIYMHLIGAEVN